MMSLSCSRPAKPGLPQPRGALARPPWRLRTAPGRPKHVARPTYGQHPGSANASDGAARGPQDRPEVSEWETQPVGDGYDGLRQRLREQWTMGTTDPGPEEKLRRVQQKLREREVTFMRGYEWASKQGNRLQQRWAHWVWKSDTETLALIQRDPIQFILRFGWLHGLTAKDAAALLRGRTQAAAAQSPYAASAAARQAGTRVSMAVRLRLESEKLESEERWCREKWESCAESQDLEGQACAAALWQHAVHKRWLLLYLPLLYRAWHPVVGDPWAFLIYNAFIFSLWTYAYAFAYKYAFAFAYKYALPPAIWLFKRAQCLLFA